MELSRIAAIKESLIELSHMQSSICDEDKNAYTSLCTSVEELKIDEEVESLIWSVDRLVINDSTNDPTLMNDSERNVHVVSGDYYSGDRTKNTSAIFHKVQKTLEVLDFLKNIVSSVSCNLRAVADAKKTYSKAVHKCFEKHGLVAPNSGPSLGCISIPQNPTVATIQNRGVLSGAKAEGIKRFQSQLLATGLDSSVGGIFQELLPDLFSELLSKIESPTFVSVWLATVSSFGGISDAHNETAEKYIELYLPTLNSIQRRVLAMKNELMTKQISCIKLVDNSQASVLKLSQKIEKVRYLIKTQQDKVERSKEEVGLILSPGGFGSCIGSGSASGGGGSNSPRKHELDDDSDYMNSLKTRSISPIPEDDGGAVLIGSADTSKDREKDDSKKEKEKEGDRIGKASKIMQQGFDRLQKARIKVLGSENQEDRLERREGRMVALEQEEKDLLTAFYAANASMDSIEESVRREIDTSLKAAKEVICHDISSFMDILKQLSSNQKDCVPLFEIPVKAFETLCDCIDGQNEFSYFTSSVHSAFLIPDPPSTTEDDRNPSVTYFTPLYNKTIEDEKAIQGIYSDTNRSEHEVEVELETNRANLNNFKAIADNQNQNGDQYQDDSSTPPIESNMNSKVSDSGTTLKQNDKNLIIDQKNDTPTSPILSPQSPLNKTDTDHNKHADTKEISSGSDILVTDSTDVNPPTSTSTSSTAADIESVMKSNLVIDTQTDKLSMQSGDASSSRLLSSAILHVDVDNISDAHTRLSQQPDSTRILKLGENDACSFSHEEVEELVKAREAGSLSGSVSGSMPSTDTLIPIEENQENDLSERIKTIENEEDKDSLMRCTRMTEEHIQLTKGFAEFQTKDLLIAELIRQKLLTEDSFTDRLGDGSSGTSTACMSPTALPPRPPLPPRLRRSEGKDRSKDRDKEREKDREKGNHITDKSTPSCIEHNGTTQEVNDSARSNQNRLINDDTSEKLSKENGEGDVKLKKSEVEKVNDGGVDSEEHRDIERGSLKIITTSTTKEIQDSPKVMRTTDRISHIVGADCTSQITVSNTTIGVNKKVPQNFGNKPEDSSELVKFGLSPTVRVLESFSCALYPKKGLLTHGRYVLVLVLDLVLYPSYLYLNGLPSTCTKLLPRTFMLYELFITFCLLLLPTLTPTVKISNIFILFYIL